MALKNPLAIRRKLLRWYGKHRRDLPWRRTHDPYAIWVAETMLQQTQVSTVAPYYERFLRELPSVRALHQARFGKVLGLWSGLGYYRRAENLKKSAGEIMRKHGGQLPNDYTALMALPGVGDYTAGALMSIAFQQPYPAIDGNARRVLYRLVNPKNVKELRRFATLLVPRARPGTFNQGLMELGATICVPKNPHCPRCPIATHCAARAKDQRIKTFRIAKSGVTKNVQWPLAIIRQEGKILLRQRARKGLLARLWELPGGEEPPRHSQRGLLASQLLELSAKFQPELRIGEFHHSITNRKIRSLVFLFDLPNNTKLRLPSRRWRWLAPASLRQFAVSSMTFKAATILANYEKNSS